MGYESAQQLLDRNFGHIIITTFPPYYYHRRFRHNIMAVFSIHCTHFIPDVKSPKGKNGENKAKASRPTPRISRLRDSATYPNQNQLGGYSIIEKTAGSKSAACAC